MGKVIVMPELKKRRLESKRNVGQLALLIERYNAGNKKFIMDKIKGEQKI